LPALRASDGDPRWELVRGDERHNVLPAGNLVTDHSELLLDATCAGLGIAEFEIWLVRDLLASGGSRPCCRATGCTTS
jgi:DNA-binding transcriptional LysR family regulator